MPSGTRLQRIADRIRQDLSEMLIREINDPRLKQIYVTDVKVDRELAYADIFVSAVEGASRSADVLAGLDSASGFIRRKSCLPCRTANLPAAALSLGHDARKRGSYRKGPCRITQKAINYCIFTETNRLLRGNLAK